MWEKKRHGAVDIVSGDDTLTIDQVDGLRRILTECVEGGQPRVVLDCQQIPLIDSAGLELLLDIREACARRAGQFRLAGVNALCADILQVTGLISLFEIHADSVVAAGSFAQ